MPHRPPPGDAGEGGDHDEGEGEGHPPPPHSPPAVPYPPLSVATVYCFLFAELGDDHMESCRELLIGPDRPDCQFAISACSRMMSAPTTSGASTLTEKWFAVEITESRAPWVFSRQGQPQRVIAALELYATLLGVMLLWPLKLPTGRSSSSFVAFSASTDNQGNAFVLDRFMSTKWPLAPILCELATQQREVCVLDAPRLVFLCVLLEFGVHAPVAWAGSLSTGDYLVHHEAVDRSTADISWVALMLILVAVPVFFFYTRALFSAVHFLRGLFVERRSFLDAETQTDPLIEYGMMTVPELRFELQRLGLSTSGLKAELVSRLRRA